MAATAFWSPLPMGRGPGCGDASREGIGAMTAVCLTTPASTWNLTVNRAAAACSETLGDLSAGRHNTLRFRFFLEFLRIASELWQSPHPPVALLMLLGLDADDIRLREKNPYCSIPGPKDLTLVLLLPTADAAREFMLSFGKGGDPDQAARTSKAEREYTDAHFRGIQKDMPNAVKLRMMQVLAEKPMATADDVFRVPTTPQEAEDIIQDPDSANPLAAMRPEHVLSPELLEHFEIDEQNCPTFNPTSPYREANGIVVCRTHAELGDFCCSLDHKDPNDPRHIMKRTPLWLQPGPEVIAKQITPLTSANPALMQTLSSMPRNEWQTIIQGNRLEKDGPAPITVADPFYVNDIPVVPEMRGSARANVLKQIISRVYPGMTRLADANGDAVRMLATDPDPAVQIRLLKKIYHNGIRTIMGNSRIGDCEMTAASSVPPPLNKALWDHADRLASLAENEPLLQDTKRFFEFPRGPETEPQRTPLHAFLRRLSVTARAYLGLTSTQIPVFVLSIMHAYGWLLNNEASLLNLMIVGPPGTGKSHVIAKILEALGLPNQMGGRESATAPGYGGTKHDLMVVGFDEADWILAIANGTLNPAWESLKKTLMEEGAAIQEITVVQKNGPPKTETLSRLCRSFSITAANYVPAQEAAGDNDGGGIRAGGALRDRTCVLKLPKPSTRDMNDGGGELADKTTADKKPHQHDMIMSALRFLGGFTAGAHLFSHLVSPKPIPDLLAVEMFRKAMAGHINVSQRGLKRVAQQAQALWHDEIVIAHLGGWLDENDEPCKLEDWELAMACRHPIPAAHHVVMAFWEVEGDYAQSQWTDFALEYLTSGVAFKTKPVDPENPDDAVEIMRGSAGDYIMTRDPDFKSAAKSISRYLNATPNAVTPGVSVIESWLRTFGGLSDKLHQNKLTEMTYDVMLGKISRSATCIAISREVAAATLSTTDIHVCSVFRRLWNNGGNHVTADGRWVVPYTPIGDCSNTEFAAKVAALDRNDATVLDPPTLYRIEQLAGTDETTNFYRKAAKELIAGRNNVRLGKSSLEKIIAALVGVKQCNFRGNDFPAIEFLTTTQVTTYIPLPTGNPTRPASAVPHPTKPGVFCTAKLVATAAVINPAFVEQAMAMHGAATQALDPKLTAAIDGYYQAMGPGNLEYLNKMADRKDFGWPLAVCPNKDKPFVEIMARKPEDSVGITVKDPKWGHKEQDPDLWVPLHAAKADMTASCLDEFYTGESKTAHFAPGSNLYAKRLRDHWGAGCNLGDPRRKFIPPWLRPWLEPVEADTPPADVATGNLGFGDSQGPTPANTDSEANTDAEAGPDTDDGAGHGGPGSQPGGSVPMSTDPAAYGEWSDSDLESDDEDDRGKRTAGDGAGPGRKRARR